jgi:hypothetical protein
VEAAKLYAHYKAAQDYMDETLPHIDDSPMK